MCTNNEENDPETGLTHVDAGGRARMVDVGDKTDTRRVARASARVLLDARTRAALLEGRLPKGEALGVARIAGIQAAKETSRLVPLCHTLTLSSVSVDFEPLGADAILVRAEAACTGPTGVEMEAMTAAAVASLTLYDMCKAMLRGVRITDLQLEHKSGGRSGTWDRAARHGDAGESA